MTIKHTCTSCNKITEYQSRWNITRKKYPDLCSTCSPRSQPRYIDRSSRNWIEVYNDPMQTGETLFDAKRLNLKYYKRECATHGPMPYAVLDNTCRKCTRERARNRNRANKDFNRPRVILASAKRRARLKNIPFTLVISDIRDRIPDICPVLGISLNYDVHQGDASPSLDRFVPSQGYTKENVRIISNRANRIKSDGTADEHFQIAVWMLRKEGLSPQQITDRFSLNYTGVN